jgi:hypothetical protein
MMMMMIIIIRRRRRKGSHIVEPTNRNCQNYFQQQTGRYNP